MRYLLGSLLIAGAFAAGYAIGRPKPQPEPEPEADRPPMCPQEILVALDQMGCQLRQADGDLQVVDPNGLVNDEIFALLVHHRSDLLALIQEQQGPKDYGVILAHDSEGILHALETQVRPAGGQIVVEYQVFRLTTEGRAVRVQ